MYAVDSFSPHTRYSVTALRNGGIALALRYHYNLSVAEIELLHAGSIAVGLICEFDTSTWHPPLHDPNSGALHGERSVAVAQRLGFPAGSVLWLTADSAIPNHEFSATYWKLAAPIIRRANYRVGAYGPSPFIDYLHDRQLADLTWQCGAASWNKYQTSRTAVLRQRAGTWVYGAVETDLNDLFDMCGCYLPDGTVHDGGTEDDMPSADEVRAIVREEVDRISNAVGWAVIQDLGGNLRGQNPWSIASLQIQLEDLATRMNETLATSPEEMAAHIAEHLEDTDARRVADALVARLAQLAKEVQST